MTLLPFSVRGGGKVDAAVVFTASAAVALALYSEDAAGATTVVAFVPPPERERALMDGEPLQLGPS